MPNRYYTKFSQSKISAKGARPSNPAGTTAAMPQKQGFCSTNLPGKASNAFAKAKAGIKEVNGYANYKGLSEPTSPKMPSLEKVREELTKVPKTTYGTPGPAKMEYPIQKGKPNPKFTY